MNTNAQTSSVLVRSQREAFPESRLVSSTTASEDSEPESEREIRSADSGTIWGFSQLFHDLG